MLILGRKEGESIIIGNDIKIKILEIKRGQVKLAIEAPKEIPVYREEIYEKIRHENISATQFDINILKEVG